MAVIGLTSVEPQPVQPHCSKPEKEDPGTDRDLCEPRYLSCRPIDNVTLGSNVGHLVAVKPIAIKRVQVVNQYGQADPE
jgi:hypothetical protein